MPELTNLDKISRLKWQYWGNAFNVVFWFTAAFGSVFTLFLNECGFDKAKIGFLVSLLPFCGPLALVIAPLTERFGFKRTFLTFYALRKLWAACFLLTPFILSRYGQEITFYWVAGAVLGFAVCRATGETAIFPWMQEAIPNTIRGKFSAVNNIISMIVGIATVATAGYVIGDQPELKQFMYLIGAGIVCGLVCVWCFSFIPGGAPVDNRNTKRRGHFSGMLHSLRDPNFRRYMIGLGLVQVSAYSLLAFGPLFMKEQIGLPTGMVIWMDIGQYAGAMITCYLWGWASDRYGSKPVMLVGACMWCIFPMICFLMPAHANMSAMIAIIATLCMGTANIAWNIGLNRYLYVSAVPPQLKTQYMAVFYAGNGLACGLGPLLAGRLLKLCEPIDTKFLIFRIDSFTPYFFLCVAVFIAGLVCMSRVRSDGAMPMKRFVSMFLQGNPFVAAGSILRYYRATAEEERVSITERLGYASNPLSNNELIEALNDPSFNVRYEAIIAIAHMKPTPELIDALIGVLGGNEPDLSSHAAWALGKLQDKSAIIALREMLYSESPLLRARAARALATLSDTASIPLLLELFAKESNPGLKIAYAQALGKMRSSVAINEMLGFLRSVEDEVLRSEMGLAMARITGDESSYIYLWRELRNDFATGTAQALLTIQKEFTNGTGKKLGPVFEQTSGYFAANDLIAGLRSLAQLMLLVRKLEPEQNVGIILGECCEMLESGKPARMEYVLLGLHTISCAAKTVHGTAEVKNTIWK